MPFKEWKDFTNGIWEESKEIFYFLGGYAEYRLYPRKEKDIEKLVKKAMEVFNQLRETKEFRRLIAETKEYQQFIENQWERNKKDALKILEELSELELPGKTITVFVTHPNLKNGFAMPQYNTIGWGHSEDWENYSTIYLCHEIMHLLTKNTNIMHALIQLMTDNELRIRLNKKGRYFTYKKIVQKEKMPPYFKELWQLEKKIYPYWEEYLKDKKGRNIIDLEKEIERKIKKH